MNPKTQNFTPTHPTYPTNKIKYKLLSIYIFKNCRILTNFVEFCWSLFITILNINIYSNKIRQILGFFQQHYNILSIDNEYFIDFVGRVGCVGAKKHPFPKKNIFFNYKTLKIY